MDDEVLVVDEGIGGRMGWGLGGGRQGLIKRMGKEGALTTS